MALPVQVATGAPITSTDHNALIPQTIRLREEQTSGTSGGTLTQATWNKRSLNVVALNEITGASMAASVITLPAGVYEVDAWASGFACASHKVKLRQTSGTPADLLIGSSEVSGAAANTVTTSRLGGRITLAGSTTIELQHNCSTTKATNGAGVAASLSVAELYAEAVFVKVG